MPTRKCSQATTLVPDTMHAAASAGLERENLALRDAANTDRLYRALLEAGQQHADPTALEDAVIQAGKQWAATHNAILAAWRKLDSQHVRIPQ